MKFVFELKSLKPAVGNDGSLRLELRASLGINGTLALNVKQLYRPQPASAIHERRTRSRARTGVRFEPKNSKKMKSSRQPAAVHAAAQHLSPTDVQVIPDTAPKPSSPRGCEDHQLDPCEKGSSISDVPAAPCTPQARTPVSGAAEPAARRRHAMQPEEYRKYLAKGWHFVSVSELQQHMQQKGATRTAAQSFAQAAGHCPSAAQDSSMMQLSPERQ